jgi:hypothetical protein
MQSGEKRSRTSYNRMTIDRPGGLLKDLTFAFPLSSWHCKLDRPLHGVVVRSIF